MAVDAVSREPLSHRYSLQTGKLTGKLPDLRRLRVLTAPTSRRIGSPYGRQWANGSETEQGIIAKYQGIGFLDTGSKHQNRPEIFSVACHEKTQNGHYYIYIVIGGHHTWEFSAMDWSTKARSIIPTHMAYECDTIRRIREATGLESLAAISVPLCQDW
jgi:hypothetical protein